MLLPTSHITLLPILLSVKKLFTRVWLPMCIKLCRAVALNCEVFGLRSQPVLFVCKVSHMLETPCTQHELGVTVGVNNANELLFLKISSTSKEQNVKAFIMLLVCRIDHFPFLWAFSKENICRLCRRWLWDGRKLTTARRLKREQKVSRTDQALVLGKRLQSPGRMDFISHPTGNPCSDLQLWWEGIHVLSPRALQAGCWWKAWSVLLSKKPSVCTVKLSWSGQRLSLWAVKRYKMKQVVSEKAQCYVVCRKVLISSSLICRRAATKTASDSWWYLKILIRVATRSGEPGGK